LAAIGKAAAAEMAKGGALPAESVLDDLGSGDAKVRTRALKVLFASDLGPDAFAAVERRLKDAQGARKEELQCLLFRSGILCLAAEGNFELIISNQSYANPDVDIEVRIDDKVAVKADFNVGTQHSFKSFLFDLKPGKHKIVAVTARGKAKYECDLEIGEKKIWGVMNYWCYPKGDRGPETAESFTMRLMDEQPMFQ
jgi:hypothetical protein